MKNISGYLIILCSLLTANSVFAEVLDPAKWVHEISPKEYNVGDTVELSFTATIDPEWYLYSSDFSRELGPTVTTFDFEINDSYTLLDSITPVAPKKKYDDIWEGEYTYFVGTGVFRQKIIVGKLPMIITGSYNYQVCTDVTGKCIPFIKEFTIGSIGESENPDTETESLWAFALGAFLAGLLALMTPCVFPLIPMTVAYFTGKGRAKAIIYGLFIIGIYVFIGSLLAPLMGPTVANELATNWVPNVIFFLVFMVFALSFFGLFDITLPNGFINAMDAKSEQGGIIGIFFMAFTLVLVTFSCTGPIAGGILVQSAGGAFLKPIVGMLAYGLAFAIPFMFFALFPSLVDSLPKSGGWLNAVKVVLGFIEFAFAFKFLSTADLAYHWGILDRDVYLSIWIVTFSLMGFYLLGKIRLPHDSKMEKVPVLRMVLAIITFSFVVYLVPGLFGAPLKPLSGYLPPVTSQDFKIGAQHDEQAISVIAGCETPMHHDILHFPHGISGYFDYEQAIACAKAQGKPLFIDFTGHGCVNCREMEARVWSDPRVLTRLKEDFVMLALYVDDRTELPEHKWQITPDGKKNKTIGSISADFQIRRFNNNAQPYYAILDSNEELLVDPPMGYNLKIDTFVAYLDLAKARFSKNKPPIEGFSPFN